MAQDHRLQQQRFELKYLIQEEITGGIRDWLSSYLELDEYGIGKPNLSYPIHSLYLDADDLATFQTSINGTKNRFKLRLRYYDSQPNSPVFFEIKRRMDNCILKERCPVRRDAVSTLLAGHLPEPGQLLSQEPRHRASLQRFNLLMNQFQAKPKVHNTYLREAWVSRGSTSTRVTMDRQVQIEPYFMANAVTEMTAPVRVFSEFVVLELKFTGRFPGWLNDMVSRFNLMQFAASKYAEGILVMDEFRFHDGDSTSHWRGQKPRVSVGAGSRRDPFEGKINYE
ncbi:MAG: polyphosphate polymerase domain-containing protein [Verrucomicrobiota bacterium]